MRRRPKRGSARRALTATAGVGLAAFSLLPAGCGDDDSNGEREGEVRSETVQRPARLPARWRTVRNGGAGFTVGVPPRWSAGRRRAMTLIRSDDRLVSISVSADRSKAGRELAPARYARETMAGLPGFAGRVREGSRPVRGSPFRSARVEATGVLLTSDRPERITAAALQQPGSVTYVLVVFRNAGFKPRFNDRRIDRVLASLRAARRGG